MGAEVLQWKVYTVHEGLLGYMVLAVAIFDNTVINIVCLPLMDKEPVMKYITR